MLHLADGMVKGPSRLCQRHYTPRRACLTAASNSIGQRPGIGAIRNGSLRGLIIPRRLLNFVRKNGQVVHTYPEPETEKERSPLDYPQEWATPQPSRRPDIFPEFEKLETPLPKPLPGDPEQPDEEEEVEKERREPSPDPDEEEEEEEEEDDEEEKDPIPDE